MAYMATNLIEYLEGVVKEHGDLPIKVGGKEIMFVGVVTLAGQDKVDHLDFVGGVVVDNAEQLKAVLGG